MSSTTPDRGGEGAPSPVGPVGVVVPVKSFTAAKQRLRPVLDDPSRARLARDLATGVAHVVTSDSTMELLVACDDDDVRHWAESVGARVVWTPGLGLNGAISAGIQDAVGRGAQHVVVAHADLARPSALPGVVAGGTITIVPDRRRDGTNVLAFPADAIVDPDYGPRSFDRHLAAAGVRAANLGCRVRVFPSPDLALDVDTDDDLRHPGTRKELPAWLRTHLDNHSTPAG